VVLAGPAGCGKSTFAARHFIRTQTVSSDECRSLVSDDPANQSVSGHAFDLMRFIIEKRLTLGRLTVADATHLERDSRTPLTRLARRFNFNSAILLFDIPLEICIARNRERRRLVPDEALKKQHAKLTSTIASLAEEDFDYVYVLDQTNQDRVTVKALTTPSAPIGLG
jgi:protein phosphatase